MPCARSCHSRDAPALMKSPSMAKDSSASGEFRSRDHGVREKTFWKFFFSGNFMRLGYVFSKKMEICKITVRIKTKFH